MRIKVYNHVSFVFLGKKMKKKKTKTDREIVVVMASWQGGIVSFQLPFFFFTNIQW